MGQDLSIEYPKHAVLITTRTIRSQLWFVNNRTFIKRVLAYLAKYQYEYDVVIYAFAILGNHYHLLARFPQGNRADFLRSFNAIIAKLAAKYIPEFGGGRLWARRARVQVVPNPEDVIDRFGYVVLNAVFHRLCKRISETNGYSSFSDNLRQAGRKYTIIDWADFLNRSRNNAKLRVSNCAKEYTLTYAKLLGLEAPSHSQYVASVSALIEKRRIAFIEGEEKKGNKFSTRAALEKTKPGDRPRTTKTSDRHSKRPLVLTLCAETRALFVETYFNILELYKIASSKFRLGDLTTLFPPGTYRPIVPVPITL